MNIYKKPMLEVIICGEEDVVRASLPDNPYQGGEVGGSWGWNADGVWQGNKEGQ